MKNITKTSLIFFLILLVGWKHIVNAAASQNFYQRYLNQLGIRHATTYPLATSVPAGTLVLAKASSITNDEAVDLLSTSPRALLIVCDLDSTFSATSCGTAKVPGQRTLYVDLESPDFKVSMVTVGNIPVAYIPQEYFIDPSFKDVLAQFISNLDKSSKLSQLDKSTTPGFIGIPSYLYSLFAIVATIFLFSLVFRNISINKLILCLTKIYVFLRARKTILVILLLISVTISIAVYAFYYFSIQSAPASSFLNSYSNMYKSPNFLHNLLERNYLTLVGNLLSVLVVLLILTVITVNVDVQDINLLTINSFLKQKNRSIIIVFFFIYAFLVPFLVPSHFSSVLILSIPLLFMGVFVQSISTKLNSYVFLTAYIALALLSSFGNKYLPTLHGIVKAPLFPQDTVILPYAKRFHISERFTVSRVSSPFRIFATNVLLYDPAAKKVVNDSYSAYKSLVPALVLLPKESSEYTRLLRDFPQARKAIVDTINLTPYYSLPTLNIKHTYTLNLTLDCKKLSTDKFTILYYEDEKASSFVLANIPECNQAEVTKNISVKYFPLIVNETSFYEIENFHDLGIVSVSILDESVHKNVSLEFYVDPKYTPVIEQGDTKGSETLYVYTYGLNTQFETFRTSSIIDLSSYINKLINMHLVSDQIILWSDIGNAQLITK